MLRTMGSLRAVAAGLLAAISTITLANCAQLNGEWIGEYYDHGPYQGMVKVDLQFKTHSNQIVGRTTQKSQFSAPLILGTCKNNMLDFTIYNHQELNRTLASFGILKQNYLFAHINWENAMTGGNGILVLSSRPSVTSGEIS